MANLKVIRRRIQSVQNTQKITRAMKMVSAAKLRRAQDTVHKYRSLADLASSMLGEAARELCGEDHPLLEKRAVKHSLILVISSNRGLCGAFNGNICRAVEKRAAETETKPSLAVIGKKAYDFFCRRDIEIKLQYPDAYEAPAHETARGIAESLRHMFVTGEVDRIEIAFNEFVSAIKQHPSIRPLIPVAVDEIESWRAEEHALPAGYIFEPDRATLLASLMPRYLEIQVCRAMLESVAAEHSARMTAMDAATENAGEMIDHLKLQYNRARQDAITRELMDIVGGAEALGWK